ncbi:MAG: HAD hydrolase-like protein [Syntrophomonadaceae bacterium]
MSRYTIIFDFDGTLVDTRVGIIRSMQYALDRMGLPGCPVERIQKLIGKSLENMFSLILGSDSSSEQIWEGVELFRSRYGKEGLLECSLYPNVIPTLQALNARKIDLYILTSKPTQFTRDMCKSLGIFDYFREIDGVDLDQKSPNKSIRLGQMMNRFELHILFTLLVGDREDDCMAAHHNEIPVMGMLHGYGSQSELETNGCRYLCKGFTELVEWVISNAWENEHP